MERWNGKIAVVTGASAGIGLATARALLECGMTVVGLARRKQRMLTEMKDLEKSRGKLYTLECDVSREENIVKAFRWIKEHVGTVQVLINNAGLVSPGRFGETNSTMWRSIIDVNLMGAIYCATIALKDMQEAKVEGHIVNVNSIEGQRVYLFGDMHLNIYPVSKHGLTAFSEGLQRELIGQNIRVTNLSPGMVKTEILDPERKNPNVYGDMPVLDSKDISDSIMYILGAPPRVQITELTIRPLGETAA